MMPWEKVTEMSLKLEFVRFAQQDNEPFRALCKRFKISTKTGYKILHRYNEMGEDGLKEQSRRPKNSPNKTSYCIESKVLELRTQKPFWGARKIRAYLRNNKESELPAVSTISEILSRNGLIQPDSERPVKAFERFEHKQPNDLWQIDFKGNFAMQKKRCHPLTVLDDHSRFSLGLRACTTEKASVVKSHFIDIFEEYGLPYRINFDNGTPWASVNSRFMRFTELSLWLIRLGVNVSFSKIKRPQTNGKIERFHLTLKKELLQNHFFWDAREAQKYFDEWRASYNFERPHEAMKLLPPASRYKPSSRKYPDVLPNIEYWPTDIVRHVNKAGNISYENKKIFISEGLKGLPIALRVKENDHFDVYFCRQKITSLDLKMY
jgi:transposase InsO family protein